MLVSHAASLPEVCGDAAVYFDPLDVQDMANKMLDTLTDPDALVSLQQKGLRVAKSLQWDTTVTKTCDVIKGLLES